ncbi:hypothetical protein [Streptomyces ossamyceticus]|jgi:hypothetical protein|uniref:hypothetical protein n=1 Tax=Streptomyces ossamyceticus TaxID=249581 RepID=UPI0012FEDA4E|nr:hypothetical protein [Streptomyces ossamyceticus]
MSEIIDGGAGRTCDLRQRITIGRAVTEVGVVAQYRSHIAELGGFARARCPSDAY